MGTKHAEKSYVGLWSHSLILEANKSDCRGLKNGYLRRILTGGGF